MTNVNQAFIKLYTEHDTSSSANRGKCAAPPQNPEAEILNLAQASCVVGVWSNGGAADGSSERSRRREDHDEVETSTPVTLKFDSHLPAVLAAAAAAAEQNATELDGGPDGVEYSRPFAQLPRSASVVHDERSSAQANRAESASRPGAQVIATIDSSHAVPRPHFDAAAAAPKADQVEERRTPPDVEPIRSPKGGGKPTVREFRPAWEVDNLEWPHTVHRLFGEQANRFDSLVARMVQLADSGAKRIAVVGNAPGAGATTLTLCLARRLSEVVEKVALVDGNLDNPQLATELDVHLEAGWEDVLAGKQVAEETAVASVEDGITVLPVMTADAALLADTVAERTALVLQDLAMNHDVVVIDAGPVRGSAGPVRGGASPVRGGVASVIADKEKPAVDAAIVVCDARQPAEQGLRETVAELAAHGITTIAVAENFQTGTAAASHRKAA